ncbi:ubiquitin carboxyl-terminal hydrolase 2 isoform X5 [Eurytemora carolleeae]|uniref:ubiquitin carboxyl-terminal hydrolase 2 isoform X5 n=1 Tax=Eurytemora carolleeae TaxID=1294199 RepID=UPI000C755AF3|nr:ubiquitin carboxyl-terminal hydrolase 2 isoform X5 [Eurytemora carolleeae]|eukprot:XP_023328080.1 ubiquitin carboxyl-terminal hydrolase 2-like isoform X5 [Eurytemora affinis]
MPVGRIYQAPTVTVVPRETPVYGYNGIKSRLPPLDTSIKPFHRKPSNQSIKQSSPAPQFKSRSPVPGIKSASPLRTLKSPSPGRCDNAGSSRSDFSEKPCIRPGSQIKRRSKSRTPPFGSTHAPGTLNTRSEIRDPGTGRLGSPGAHNIRDPGMGRENLENVRGKSWSPDNHDIINNNSTICSEEPLDNARSNQQPVQQTYNQFNGSPHSNRSPQFDRSPQTNRSSLSNGSPEPESPKLRNEKFNQTSGETRFKNGENSCEKTGGSGATGGLKNLGNTCFMNSVIQCLSNTKLLCDFLLSDEYSNDINSNSSMKGSLIKAFATVVKSLWKPNARTVDPSTLKGAVQRFAPRFSGYNQEDSQEFLRYLLEGLHEDVNRVTVKPQSIHTEIDSNLSVEEQGMEAWKRYLRRDDSKLVDIFVGQLKSTLRCSSCDYESVTFEPFWDLSLPIPSRSGEISLHECLENFTKEEVMDGDEMPTCGRCKTRRRCTKFYSLYKLPKVLVVHLKRFSPTEKYRSKLSNSVTFPLTSFDVSKFSDCPGRSTYSCYAVSNHSGTLYSGHYTAYARNPKTSQWHYFNDSRVSSSSSGSVISNEAYLLFFELLS